MIQLYGYLPCLPFKTFSNISFQSGPQLQTGCHETQSSLTPTNEIKAKASLSHNWFIVMNQPTYPTFVKNAAISPSDITGSGFSSPPPKTAQVIFSWALQIRQIIMACSHNSQRLHEGKLEIGVNFITNVKVLQADDKLEKVNKKIK